MAKIETPSAVQQTKVSKPNEVYTGSDYNVDGTEVAYGPTAAEIAARDAAEAAKVKAAEKLRAGQSAYDLLYGQFKQYNLQSLIEPLKKFITEGLSEDELTLKLRETEDYKKRFAANAERIKKGLSALNEAEYIAKEDAYQNLMRENKYKFNLFLSKFIIFSIFACKFLISLINYDTFLHYRSEGVV